MAPTWVCFPHPLTFLGSVFPTLLALPCLHARSGSPSTNITAKPAVLCLTSSWAMNTISAFSVRTFVGSVNPLASPRTRPKSSRQVPAPSVGSSPHYQLESDRDSSAPPPPTRTCGLRKQVAPGDRGEEVGRQDLSPYRGISSPSGINLKPFEYKEHDFRMPPKFLTPLLDRVIVAGYAAALYCAVRGDPKVPCVRMRARAPLEGNVCQDEAPTLPCHTDSSSLTALSSIYGISSLLTHLPALSLRPEPNSQIPVLHFPLKERAWWERGSVYTSSACSVFLGHRLQDWLSGNMDICSSPGPGLGKPWPAGQSYLPLVSLNEILLEHNPAHLLTCCLQEPQNLKH